MLFRKKLSTILNLMICVGVILHLPRLNIKNT